LFSAQNVPVSFNIWTIQSRNSTSKYSKTKIFYFNLRKAFDSFDLDMLNLAARGGGGGGVSGFQWCLTQATSSKACDTKRHRREVWTMCELPVRIQTTSKNTVGAFFTNLISFHVFCSLSHSCIIFVFPFSFVFFFCSYAGVCSVQQAAITFLLIFSRPTGEISLMPCALNFYSFGSNCNQILRCYRVG